MKLIIFPNESFSELEKKGLTLIIKFAEKLLLKNKIGIPHKIYFYNSFSDFIEKVLPEVENYGFDGKISKEIIKCALNNGTYGTINFKENSIIEMNFNPFNNGEYFSIDFLKLIIHEALHLHLSNRLNKDINSLKFKFNKEKFTGNEKIIQIDEGYAEFMTNRILKGVNIKKIRKIKIPQIATQKPNYQEEISGIDISKFDKNFEKLVISNRERGLKDFKEKFQKDTNNEEILKYALNRLESII